MKKKRHLKTKKINPCNDEGLDCFVVGASRNDAVSSLNSQSPILNPCTSSLFSSLHHPVLVQTAVDGLAIKPSGFYVDATLGRCGHAMLILQHLSSSGKLLGIDQDLAAIYAAREKLGTDERVILHHGSFTELKQLIQSHGKLGKVDGILLDLGVSSPQLDEAARGFSFLREGPLDMRMNQTVGETAAAWLQRATEKEMTDVLKTYGEERYAKSIARAIIETRLTTPIQTTTQLAKLIEKTIPFREKHKHPATRSFQAIRIYINRELDVLEQVLPQCLDVLAIGGRLAVISFHSLEDRRVKQFIREQERGDDFPIGLPIRFTAIKRRLKSIGKAIKPTEAEIAQNPRARSAVLRIAEKVRIEGEADKGNAKHFPAERRAGMRGWGDASG